LADGRLQQLEQVRVSPQEVGIRKVGTQVGPQGRRRLPRRSPEQAQARGQEPGRRNIGEVRYCLAWVVVREKGGI